MINHAGITWLQLSSSLLLLSSTANGSKDEPKKYLYYDLPEGESAEPIIEYHDEALEDKNQEEDIISKMPDFLEQDYLHHRVVLFYSQTCPHCIDFQSTYVHFARQFHNLTSQDTLYRGLDVQFFAISCINYKKICRRNHIKSYPLMKIFPASQQNQKSITMGQSELHPMTLLKALALGTGIIGANNTSGDKFNEGTGQRDLAPKDVQDDGISHFSMTRSQTQLYDDAYLTFFNAMKDSVFLEEGPLQPKPRRQSLKQFLMLLKKTLPPWRLNPLINELLGDFYNNVDVEARWNAILEKHPPQQTQWSLACQQHESPYTCGLWTLFHIMAVGVVEYNLQIDDPLHNKFSVISAPLVALELRDYIHHFFLCEECSTHFVEAFNACEYNRCQRLTQTGFNVTEWQEFPLWLLEFHNGVNVRLQTERFRREGRHEAAAAAEEETVLWPPVAHCPTCWIYPMKGASSKYNSSMMYQYLRMVYWPNDGETLVLQKELFEKQQGGLQLQRQLKLPQPTSYLINGIQIQESNLVFSAAVVGVWLVVIWKRSHLNRLLGIHRSKIHAG